MRHVCCLLIAVLLLSSGCLSEAGDTCRLDSDCDGSLVCGLDSVCTQPTCAVNGTCPQDADAAVPDVEEGCTAPASKRRADEILVLVEGGLKSLAALANPVIEDGIASGDTVVELWVYGDLPPLCDDTCVWTTAEAQLEEDCTPIYGMDFPLPIPLFGGFTALVTDVTYDTKTGKLTGVLNEDDILQQVPEGSLRDTADGLIETDVDTDSDGTPDMVSVVLTIKLAADASATE